MNAVRHSVGGTFALLIALVLLQTAVMPQIKVLGVHPDLLLLAVTSWSLLCGAEAGMLWALIAGVALDLVSGAPFGMSTLPLLLVSFGAGLGQRGIFRFELAIPILVIPLATLIDQAAMLAWLKAFGWPVTWAEGLSRVILPSILVNTLAMPFVYWLLRLLSRRITRHSWPIPTAHERIER
jgi:rod shape-determining protein MreD